MYSNISQILLLYKMGGITTNLILRNHWGYFIDVSKYHNAGHGLKLATFYVQKHIAALGMSHNPPLVLDKLLGAPACVKLVYSITPVTLDTIKSIWWFLMPWHQPSCCPFSTWLKMCEGCKVWFSYTRRYSTAFCAMADRVDMVNFEMENVIWYDQHDKTWKFLT